jgi:uncharacterized delta-60 repeat protein
MTPYAIYRERYLDGSPHTRLTADREGAKLEQGGQTRRRAMSGSRQRKEGFGCRPRVAVMLVAVGVAVASSLGTVALGSSTASVREGRSSSVDLAYAIGIGRDGKLVVAGSSAQGSSTDFAVARFANSGRLDRSFGTGGKVLTSFGRGSYAGARALAVRPDGKVVVAGGAAVPPRIYNGFAIARYTVAGKLDRTFGRNGKVLMYFGSRRSNVSNLAAVAIQADGKVVAVGFSSYWPIGGRSSFALARYTVRGRLDRSFGRDGKVLTDFAPRGSSNANAVAIQPDGKIVAAGGAFISDRDYKEKFALARYNADGTLDRSFGNRGKVVTKVGELFTEAIGVIVQPDGKLLVAGNGALARYGADGKLDMSFGSGGMALDGVRHVSAVAMQRDRKLVTAGTGMGPHYLKFSLARFLEDGSRDESFGRPGKLLADFGTRAVGNAVVVRTDGKVVVAGTVGGRDFALARYSSSGRLDGSFGSGGKVRTDFDSVWAIRGR